MRAFRLMTLLWFVAVLAACSSYGGFYPGHPKYQSEVEGEQVDAYFRYAQNNGKAILAMRMPDELWQMPEWRKLDGTPAGEAVFSRLRHFVTLDGWSHSGLSDKFAMIVVEPGDYFLGGNFNRYSTVALQEKPANLLPKPAPAPFGYTRFVSEMYSEPYVYTETVDYFKPVITGFVGAGYGAVPVTEDMYMGTKNYAATGYRKAIPTVTERIEPTLLSGGRILTVKVTAKAGEILILPEVIMDRSARPIYDSTSCSDEGRREWMCPIRSVPYLYKNADVQGFLTSLKKQGLLHPWSTVVKAAPIVHNDQIKPAGFARDGYVIYVLGEMPEGLKPVNSQPATVAPEPPQKPKPKKLSR